MKIEYRSLEDDENMSFENTEHQAIAKKDSINPKSSNSCTSLYKGLIYSATSSLFFSITRVIVKSLKNIDPSQLALSRFIGIFSLAIPLIIKHGGDPLGPKELRPYLILRGIAGATNLFLRFYAMRHLPIGEAAVIVSTVPVFVSIFACVCLKESCGATQAIAAVLTMIGLSLIVKLPVLVHYVSENAVRQSATEEINAAFSTDRVYGIITACSSTIFAASVFILIRKVKTAHHSIILFNFGWVAIIESVVITTFVGGFSMPETFKEWFLIILVAVFGFGGQLALTLSLQSEEAGPVSVARSALDVTLTMTWQLLFFADIPDVWTIMGTILVLGSVIVIGLQKWFQKKELNKK